MDLLNKTREGEMRYLIIFLILFLLCGCRKEIPTYPDYIELEKDLVTIFRQ